MIIKNEKSCGSIYCITNLITNKRYIGQTSVLYINNRWCQHKLNARNGVKSYLYNAIRKYGEENFTFKVLLYKIDISKLNFYENLWIEKLGTKVPNGYNLTNGGEGTRGKTPWNKGVKRSKKTIDKIKKYYNNPEIKEKLRKQVLGKNNPMYGRKGKDNPSYGRHCFKEDNPFYGKHHSKETKEKLSDAHLKEKKKVIMKDISTNEIILIFNSLSEAAKYLRENTKFIKADDSAIGKCVKGIYKYVYGHKWEKIN